VTPVRRFRPLTVLVAVVLVTGSAAVGAPASASPTRRSAPDLQAFRGLGTWVDVYDYAPKFQSVPGALPAVIPASVDDMARLGVRTLYLQAAQDDTRSEGTLVDRGLVGQILQRAHQRGLRVVAWYLPHFADISRDLARIRALAAFRTHDQRFDGVALDIEWTSDVKDTTRRNQALVQLAARARRAVTRVPLGAIVLEPVLIEDVNPAYWPSFPWKALRDSFDVWLPMSYWTNRSVASGWRDSARYTSENIRRIRAHLGRRDAPIHAAGGVADRTGPGDIEGFVTAARRAHALGWSLYDYVTTSSSAWTRLRRS
jgi:hypothetical protein